MARRGAAVPSASFASFRPSGASTITTSPPSAFNSSINSGRRTRLIVLTPRALAKAMTARPTPELAAFWTTGVARREVDELTQQQPGGGGIDGQHGELLGIDIGWEVRTALSPARRCARPRRGHRAASGRDRRPRHCRRPDPTARMLAHALVANDDSASHWTSLYTPAGPPAGRWGEIDGERIRRRSKPGQGLAPGAPGCGRIPGSQLGRRRR